MSKKTENKTWIKMSGAGNRFWISYFPSRPPKQGWPGIARALCRNKTADGLVILLPSASFDFEWLFYNADGSTAEMCGNAACCVTNYIFTKKLMAPGKTTFRLKTESGPVKGEWIKGRARIFLSQSQNIKGPFPTCKNSNKESLTYMFINSAVPHAVVRLSAFPATKKAWAEKTKQARRLRQSLTHSKQGMNVSFYTEGEKKSVKKTGPAKLTARTFERGVEDFTPACGTGALAVAQIYRTLYPNLNSVLVKMPGGELTVTFHPGKKISLMSPVKKLSERRV